MVDEFQEVEYSGFGSNIVSSFQSTLAGIVLFVLSFPVLWWNEGRVNLSKVAKNAIPVDASKDNPAANGKLVALSGTLSTEEMIGDPQFLKPGNYLLLKRKVEMYAWEEKRTTTTKKQLGGGKKKITRYTYKQVWTENPQSSASFRYRSGHENPSLPIHSQVFRARNTTMGIYKVDIGQIKLPQPTQLPINQSQITADMTRYKLSSPYLFSGRGTPSSPQIGDYRISFYVLPNHQKGTLMGKLEGKEIKPFVYKGATLYRFFTGNKSQAVKTLAAEHSTITWILRLIGFLMMWIGLNLVFEPLTTFLDILPFLGDMGRGMIMVITLVPALILTFLTIVISMIFHNMIALIITIAIIGGGIYFWASSKKETKLQKTG
ncbi:MAG: hypothetical protein D6785_05215 [Planctomycetota bacterium]|nr:MAG: hypothetical protein D6785_05215 [Planctomycetota bacterium]